MIRALLAGVLFSTPALVLVYLVGWPRGHGARTATAPGYPDDRMIL